MFKEPRRPAPGSKTGLGRLMREKRTVHIPDLLHDAAYAEAGRFEEALATVQKTYDLGRKMGATDIAEAALERAKLYRMGKPFRQP